MSDNEMELLNIIRKSEDPEKALAVAVQIITNELEQRLIERICESEEARRIAEEFLFTQV